MIERLVGLALRAPLLVIMLVATILCGGIFAYKNLDIEAYPNPVPPLIEVIAQPNGLSAEEVEKYVTVPLEVGLAGMPGLEHVRTQSLFGLADVKCYFKWGTDYDKARQEVINRLGFVQLPAGVQAELSPWSAIGEVFRYTVEGQGYTLSERKTAEDWILERQFKQVPGVADVVSFGGTTKQYQVKVDPVRLTGAGVTMVQLLNALQAANQNIGGGRLTLGEQSYDVRGVGLIKTKEDIENVVLASKRGTPIRVRDVGEVVIGDAPRLGMIGKDDDPDVVQGTVLMRYGAETPSVLEGIHARVEYIRQNRLLPPGMEIKPYYDRGALVEVTTHTVRENLAMGMCLVSLILLVFLGNPRAAFVPALVIPLALLVAFMGIVLSGSSANLISLGAIDFGIVVDSAVIMTENIFHKLGPKHKGTMIERTLAAAKEVASPMAFATLIIGVSFLPLFTMTGVSGVIFAPMARTYAFAIGGAITLALTLAPFLASRTLRTTDEDKDSWAMKRLHRIYAPLFSLGVRRPGLAAVIAGVPVIVLLSLFGHIGREFMPKLEEGNIWIRATLPTSISRETALDYANKMRAIVRGCPPKANGPCDEKTRKNPQISSAVSQLGRPDDGTDVTGFNNIEIFAPLRPMEDWPKGSTKDKLTNELQEELESSFPGVIFAFSQMISDNVEEAVAGVKGENSIKVFGTDIVTNERLAEQIVTAMNDVKGVEDLGYFRSTGQPNVRITPDRVALARYGLNTGDAMSVVAGAIGGQAVTRVYEGDKFFDLTVRYKEAFRNSVTSIEGILLSTPDGAQVPLAQVAKVEMVEGPQTIYREEGQRYTPVKFSIRGRDLATAVEEAQATVKRAVELPIESHLEWNGELNELKNAQLRLMIILPITLLLVTMLAYTAVKSARDTIIVLCNVPVAVGGGALALTLTHTHLSVSAAMGFVSLLGISIQDAILVVTFFQRLRADGDGVTEAAKHAVEKRLRPCLMTSLVSVLGLSPAALSSGIGSETQKPLALVVIGGALCLAIVSRLLQPALLVLAHRRSDTRPAPEPADLGPQPTLDPSG